MVYLGKDSRELKWEIIEKERKPTQDCVIEWAMPIGDCCNHVCLIHKTLIYKTLKSLIKCTSEVSAWGIKGEACIHRISSTTIQECDPTSVTVPVPAHAEVPSRFLSIPLRGSEKLPRTGRGGTWFPPEAGIVWLHLCEAIEAFVGLVITAVTGVNFGIEKI